MVKLDPAKLAWIGEDQCATPLVEDQMIVLAGLENRWFCPQGPGHAQVQPQPTALRESKKHLLSMSFRFKEPAANKHSWQKNEIDASKDSFLAMQGQMCDTPPDTGVPLAAKVLNFGEFRHTWSMRVWENRDNRAKKWGGFPKNNERRPRGEPPFAPLHTKGLYDALLQI